MSRHPSSVTSGGDGMGDGVGCAAEGGKQSTRAAVDSLLRSAVCSAENVGGQIISSGKKMRQQIVPKMSVNMPGSLHMPQMSMPMNMPSNFASLVSSRAAQEAAARRNFAEMMAEDVHATPMMHSDSEWVHINVAPAPAPPVEDTPTQGASRDWKIIFDVYRDEYKRKESSLLSSAARDGSKSLKPVIFTHFPHLVSFVFFMWCVFASLLYRMEYLCVYVYVYTHIRAGDAAGTSTSGVCGPDRRCSSAAGGLP